MQGIKINNAQNRDLFLSGLFSFSLFILLTYGNNESQLMGTYMTSKVNFEFC